MGLLFATKKVSPKNRGRLDIVRDILGVASVRVRKTRIMYQANLSFYQVDRYLNGLLENGLVEHYADCYYLVTAKGREFLQMYGKYLERCERLGAEIGETEKNKLSLETMCFSRETSDA